MKPPDFFYHRPNTRTEAVGLLAELGDDAAILAGGQSLIPMLNMRLAVPQHLIDINRIQDFPSMDLLEGELRIGAGVRQRQLEVSPIAREQVPILSEALAYVGHRSIRERGTVVGSIAHADPAGELPALLLLLRGSVVTDSAAGGRYIPGAEFLQGFFRTARESDELVSAVRFSQMNPEEGWAFMEVARRSGDFALCGVGAIVGPASARVVLFGVEGRPRLFDVTDAVFGNASLDEALDGLKPLSDIHGSAEFRHHLAMVLSVRAIGAAQERRASGSAYGWSSGRDGGCS